MNMPDSQEPWRSRVIDNNNTPLNESKGTRASIDRPRNVRRLNCTRRQMAERFGIIRQTFGDVINVDVATSWNESSISFIPNRPSSFFLREKRSQAWRSSYRSTELRSNFPRCYTIPRSAFTRRRWISLRRNSAHVATISANIKTPLAVATGHPRVSCSVVKRRRWII